MIITLRLLHDQSTGLKEMAFLLVAKKQNNIIALLTRAQEGEQII